MASSWGFGNMSMNAPTAGGGGEQAGPDIEQVDTTQLAFQDEAVQPGDRVKLFAQPWPADSLPRPGASLLAIASQRKLLAAAGPDGLILTGTAALRSQYIPRRRKKNESQGIRENEPALRLYSPEIKLDVPRLSHVAFCSDESCLVIAAEQGGGLACYDVNALTNGSKEPAFQVATMGQPVRQVLCNPNPGSDFTAFIGIVLENGLLLLADLRTKALVKNAGGSEVFHEGVKCASWSKLGKQIVAGLEDSTCAMIDFQGNVKDRIPQPPQLANIKQTGNDGMYATNLAFPTSTVYWLETHKFLIIYTPQANQPSGPDDPMPNHNSLYFIAQREKGKPFVFRQLQDDPCMAAMEPKRFPAVHYIQRLNEWAPALQDMLIMTSSATPEVGTLASFQNQNNGDFFVANFEETRKAALSMSYIDEIEDTSAVGMAMDFSAVETAPRPIPAESDTIEDSPFPLPALCILNTDGVLQMWWIIYTQSVKQTEHGGPFPYSAIVNKQPPFITYTHYQVETSDNASNDSTFAYDVKPETANELEEKRQRERLLATQSPFSDGVRNGATAAAASRPTTANGASAFGRATAASTPQVAQPTFGAPSSFGGTSQLGQKASPWGSAAAAKPAFGQPTFGQPSSPASSTFGSQPAKTTGTFGQQPTFGSGSASTPSASATFGKPAFGAPSALGSSPAPATAFGQPSTIGGGTGFGQVGGMGASKPSIWGTPSATAPKGGNESPFATSKTGVQSSGFASFANKASPFANAGGQSASPFALAGNGEKSAFSAIGQGEKLGGFGKPSAPTLANENSGSTATIGSTPSGWSFGESSALSREATMGRDDSFKQAEKPANGFSGFKLSSGFKGDGTAKDDLPKPKNPGAGLFGDNFLGGTEAKKSSASSPFIKPEPGTEDEPSMKDIPAAPTREAKVVPEEAPLPPDPSTYNYSAAKIPDDMPLPPDPSTFKAPKIPDDMPLPPDFTAPGSKPEVLDDDVPVAGSPPINVSHSQTFSSASGGPSEDDGSGFEDEEDEEEGGEEEGSEDEGDEEDEGEEEGSDEDSWEPDEDETTEPQDANALNAFMNRVTPPAKKPEKPSALAREASYTPAGLPKGPTFPPPQNRPILSPRSPSLHRAVTSPVRSSSNFNALPQQIKTTSVPPAKPVERPAPAPKAPRQPTAGELEDEAADRVRDTLSQDLVPSTQLPTFYTHKDYAGTVDKPGVGGQIETVYRDVNSMIDVLGLNARSLGEFMEGHVQLRKPGRRTREDLEVEDTWCLGDVAELGDLTEDIAQQLERGQLERVSALLADLGEQQRVVLQLKAKTTEMRKQINSRTNPEKLAMQAAAPLSTELQAQQSELRQGVQAVQSLLTDVENKLALLRADITAKEGQKKGPVPTVEAVTNTILKMTAMVEQRSGDIDVLESQIKRLPNGIADLRLEEDYEDDLVSALGGSKLLTGSPARSTPRRPRMAANGDALGMSGMFGSRFATPPSNSLRRSRAFTPEMSAFGRSTGSAGGSARKKMQDVTIEEVEAYQARITRRKAVLGSLKAAVEARADA